MARPALRGGLFLSVTLHGALLAWVLATPGHGRPKRTPPVSRVEAAVVCAAAPCTPPAEVPAVVVEPVEVVIVGPEREEPVAPMVAPPTPLTEPMPTRAPATFPFAHGRQSLRPVSPVARTLEAPEVCTSPAAIVPPAVERAATLVVVPGTNVPPDYPSAARRRGHEGTVLLRVVCDAAGAVVQVEILQGSGHALLDEAAVRAVKVWRFDHGPGEVQQSIEFRLGSRQRT